ncbi:flagellar hook capping FlgD N-terminal domain-containing protein [Pseudodesulfovibrio sp. zrk46]|uniref:flagellar hook assembly protein FlgD n=1 Tax=Pseudodesulfovibrio sp. zrk46 TaxID=2725288 RepID=UPI001449F124|nr:flagellar hook capping FlgD N-terminal domain-containing protein [Pseudodesulfovibrio sp. zrk46]QJB57225.1 flagellar hook assembly protein FlgD [Pseudodesulfovibrio sp. zrk46]
MSIETTSYYDSLLLSSSTSSVEYTTTEEATNLTSEDFLTLLVTELEYQDPTDPMDNTEMVNQLTQYSQLDELTALNEGMQEIVDAVSTMTASNGLDYLGKEIEADGSTIVKSDNDISTMYFELEEDAASVTCNIYDSDGSIVATETFDDVSSGTNAFTWDGYDYNGDEMDDGQYTVLLTAYDSDGEELDVSTTTTGTVTGVASTDEGVILTLEDGRTVNMVDVTYATT